MEGGGGGRLEKKSGLIESTLLSLYSRALPLSLLSPSEATWRASLSLSLIHQSQMNVILVLNV